VISLRGRRALVTGGSRGIGAATALLLAQCGADVGIGYRSREADAAEVVRQLAACGVRAFSVSADISTEAGAEALFERVARELSKGGSLAYEAVEAIVVAADGEG